jgi:electron transfer flavoprotein alpha subunit
MKILVLGEHHNGKVKDSTLATLGAAASLGGDTDLLLIGSEASGAPPTRRASQACPRCWSPPTPPSTTSWQRRSRLCFTV